MQLQSILQKKSYFLALVSFIVIIAISLMKSAMELEDAEQAYFSQWFRFVYDDQPPLYTWLQYGINSVFGISVVSFSLLRAIIFTSIIVVLYKFSETYLNEVTKANLVIFLLAIIPVFIDFTFRRLSHTSLLCLAVVLTYMLLQNLIAKSSQLQCRSDRCPNEQLKLPPCVVQVRRRLYVINRSLGLYLSLFI